MVRPVLISSRRCGAGRGFSDIAAPEGSASRDESSHREERERPASSRLESDSRLDCGPFSVAISPR